MTRRLGHSKTESVDFYINIANDLNKQLGKKSNLFDQALRQPKIGGKVEKRDSRSKKVAISKYFSHKSVWARLSPYWFSPYFYFRLKVIFDEINF